VLLCCEHSKILETKFPRVDEDYGQRKFVHARGVRRLMVKRMSKLGVQELEGEFLTKPRISHRPWCAGHSRFRNLNLSDSAKGVPVGIRDMNRQASEAVSRTYRLNARMRSSSFRISLRNWMSMSSNTMRFSAGKRNWRP